MNHVGCFERTPACAGPPRSLRSLPPEGACGRPGRQCRVVVAAALTRAGSPPLCARMKEIASVQGVRANQLVGYGLVVGLDGTGEQNAVTGQSLSALLQSLGVTLPPGVVPQGRNSAAVMVTAELPAFAQPGQTIDIASRRWAMPRACVAAPW
jgi:hypothetical protein